MPYFCIKNEQYVLSSHLMWMKCGAFALPWVWFLRRGNQIRHQIHCNRTRTRQLEWEKEALLSAILSRARRRTGSMLLLQAMLLRYYLKFNSLRIQLKCNKGSVNNKGRYAVNVFSTSLNLISRYICNDINYRYLSNVGIQPEGNFETNSTNLKRTHFPQSMQNCDNIGNLTRQLPLGYK
jgi:hypothetical protein